MTENEKVKQQLEKALIKIKQAKERIDTLQHDPIAIIGIGCRFPGNVNNADEFWKMLIEERDGIIEVPSSRWDIDTFYDSNKEAPGKMYVRKGGFLGQPIDAFDAKYFGISPKEAEEMDPQQRFSLEVAVEALENASIPLSQISGTNTGVYMGICFNDYGHLIEQSGGSKAIDRYYGTGNHYSVLSGRIAYCLGLKGPALSIDTACSSSLVTIDAAVKDLRLGRCDLALAGGVNLILTPESTINFCKAGMLSEDGYCKTFDASADGYVRGEGCGIVVLKRLNAALADHDQIYGVIRGSFVNQDGATTGLTVPNGPSQEEVMRSALKNAQVSPNNVSYVEAHGTGTPLGDPIEVEALNHVYAKDRDPNNPLWIGSVKGNIGHTEACAGVAGVIKAALSLKHRKIPKQLHFKKLNPEIHLDNAPISVVTQETEISGKGPIAASVSSFGFCGTNAHVVIEEPPSIVEKDVESKERPLHILTVSAKTEAALDRLIQKYKQFLGSTDCALKDLCYTSNIGRSHHTHRAAIFGRSKEEIKEKIEKGDYQRDEVVEEGSFEPNDDRADESCEKLMQDVAMAYSRGKTIDWQKFHAGYVRKKAALPSYPFEQTRYWIEIKPRQEEPEEITEQKEEVVADLLLSLNSSVPDEHEEIVRDYITEKLRVVLKLPETEPLEEKKGFFEMGMDSVAAVELATLLNVGLGSDFTLKNSIAFDYPTIFDLTSALVKVIESEEKPEVKEKDDGSKVEQIQADVEQMNAKQIEEDLLKELEDE